MEKRYIDNPGTTPMLVGGMLIPPGEGREVLLPRELLQEPQDFAETQPQPDQPPLVEASELLKKPLKDILPQLDGMSDEQLATLVALEAAAPAARVTLTQAIAKLQLDRAGKKVAGDDDNGTTGAGGGGGEGGEGAPGGTATPGDPNASQPT